MTYAVSAYLEARRALTAAEAEITRQVATITSAADALRDWRNVRVSNGTIGMPIAARISAKAPLIDAHQWPSAQALEAALAAWHRAFEAADRLWKEIPDAARGGLQPVEEEE